MLATQREDLSYDPHSTRKARLVPISTWDIEETEESPEAPGPHRLSISHVLREPVSQVEGEARFPLISTCLHSDTDTLRHTCIDTHVCMHIQRFKQMVTNGNSQQ